MKIVFKKEVLVGSLEKVASIKAKGTIPILQGIYMEANSEEVRFTCSDSNETIQDCIAVDGENVEVIESGQIVLPRQVIDIAKKLTKDITFTLENFSINIKSGRSKFDLNCLDPDEYPKLPKGEFENPTLKLRGTEFGEIIKKTAYAASKSETRPILTGVCFQSNEDCIDIVSTDSHRLAKIKLKLEKAEEFKLVVPAKSLETALKVFDLKNDVEVYTQNNTQLILRNGPTFFITRLLEGNYPDTSRLIPQSSKSCMKIGRKDFLQSLELISGIANDGDSVKGVAKLHVNGLAALSTHQSQAGKGLVEIPYESLEGEDDFTISFSIKFLIETLKALSSDLVEFKYEGSMRPFLVVPCESKIEEVQLVLPVRTY